MTYATLKADIAQWARRSDLTGAIPSFVALAEMEIYKTHATPLRVREMEDEATLTVTGLVATVPTDFLEARYIKLDDNDHTTILYKSPESWNPHSTGFFTIVGDEIRLPNNVTSNIKIVYLAQPVPLVNDADTNSVLDNYYGIYLSASMKYASVYVKDLNSAPTYQTQLDTFLNAAARHSKPMTAGSLVVRTA